MGEGIGRVGGAAGMAAARPPSRPRWAGGGEGGTFLDRCMVEAFTLLFKHCTWALEGICSFPVIFKSVLSLWNLKPRSLVLDLTSTGS